MSEVMTYEGMFEVRIRKQSPALEFKIPALPVYALDNPAYYNCDICGEEKAVTDLNEIAEVFVCDHCRKKYVSICDYCGAVMVDISGHPNHSVLSHVPKKVDKIVRINGEEKTICKHCYVNEFKFCNNCKTIVPRNETITHNGNAYCKTCTAEKFTPCSACRALVFKEALIDGVCKTCFVRANSVPPAEVQAYGTKPRPVFLSLASGGMLPYYGIELEVDQGSRTDLLMRQLARFKEIYLKSDSSLSRNGIEIVSYPMNVDYHRAVMRWDNVFSAVESAGYKSHNTPNCGYHIHVNRGAFGESKRNQQKYIAFFLHLFMKFKTQIMKFSRRTDFHYCAFWDGYRLSEKVTRSYQSYQYYNDSVRNLAVNFRNENTVEIRVFRGTLDRTSFLAAIGLIDTLIKLALSVKTEEELRSINWDKVRINATVPELITYMDKKHL